MSMSREDKRERQLYVDYMKFLSAENVGCLTSTPWKRNPCDSETVIFRDLSPYHGCWSTGSYYSQAINNKNIDCVR